MTTSFPPRRFRRALTFVRPHRRAVLILCVLTLLGAGLGAAEPLLLKGVFDQLGAGGPKEGIAVGILQLIAVGLGREALAGVANWMSWRTRLRIHFGLLDATVDRLHRLPLVLHRSEGVGALMTRLDRGIQGFVGAITEIGFNVLPAIAYLLLAVIFMVQLDWRLTLLVIAFVPLPGVIAARAAPVQIQRERVLLNRWAKIYSRFNEVLSGILTVRSFAMGEAEKRRFLHDVREANEVVVRGVGFDARVGVAQNATVTTARVAAVGLGAYLVIGGEASIGTLVAFLGYAAGLFGPVQGLTGIYRTLRTASVSVDQVFSILDAEEHVGDAPDAVEPGPLRGEVEFRDVVFGYRDDEPPILKGIDLHVAPGERVALVGPSGAGKSTLMALLQRLYDPQRGEIRIDGMDLRALKQTALRAQIGVVLQEPLLFNDTVRNNIAYGRPDASCVDIENAARAASAHEFILRLPLGYDTVVGERGGLLSGGERQRIAIARALLKNPPVLVLDEATSALDAESEALVQEALDHLTRGRTTFVIAHRLSTVVAADRILVLRDGQILESGPHHELVARQGYYASLVRKQLPDRLCSTSTAEVFVV